MLKLYYGDVPTWIMTFHAAAMFSFTDPLPYPPYVAKLWILGNLLAYTKNDPVILIIIAQNILEEIMIIIIMVAQLF